MWLRHLRAIMMLPKDSSGILRNSVTSDRLQGNGPQLGQGPWSWGHRARGPVWKRLPSGGVQDFGISEPNDMGSAMAPVLQIQCGSTSRHGQAAGRLRSGDLR